MIWIVLIVVIFLVGIIFFRDHSESGNYTGEQFQRSLEKFLEGKVKPMPDGTQGFMIEFQFEGCSFVYEDVSDSGFAQDARKAYLKVKMDMDFTLYFTEKPRSTAIITDVIIVSQIPNEPIQAAERVRIPDPLKGLDVQTNNSSLVNKLLANPKAVEILLEFRNADSRGFPSIGWKVLEGVMILEFHSAEGKNPNYRVMRRNLSSLDDYLEDLAALVKFIKTAPEGLHK